MRRKKERLMTTPFVYNDDSNYHGEHKYDGSNDGFLSHGSNWTRVRQGNKYGYVRTNADGTPVDFDETTGYFTVFDQPNVSSHHFQSYKLPDNSNQSAGIPFAPIYDGGTLDNVDIYPSTSAGIERTPDDHYAALARDRAVDEYVNSTTPNGDDYFNLGTLGGMNNLSASQWVGRIKDTPDVINGSMSIPQYINRWYFGNHGIPPKSFAEEYPTATGIFNLAADIAAPIVGIPLKRGLTNGVDLAKNWRPWVPNNANRYYRIVGKTGNPIGDAIDSGVIRGPGMNPNLDDALFAGQGRFDLGKTYTYPMFSKGSPWKGGTARASEDFQEKPIIIRSKKDTGPIIWEESNKDFRHKGHDGIYRPSYYGDTNASPTQFFEYWEPRRFGYMRKDFPKSDNPWATFLGNGYRVERGNWDSSLGVDGKRFGDYIGSGSEQTVFEDLSAPDQVLKVGDFYHKDLSKLRKFVSDFEKERNAIPLQEPIRFEGIVDREDYPYPVFSQPRLQPLGKMSTAEFNKTYLQQLQEELLPFGFTGDGVNTGFTNGLQILTDMKPENMGLTSDGKLRFFDVMSVKNKKMQ